MIQTRKAMPEADRRRLNARRKLWTHPRQPSLTLPRKTVAALALMHSGIRDYEVIAAAVGLDATDVAAIDCAEDRNIRRIGVDGIPCGEYFTLLEKVRCPGCGAWITVAPCVACNLLTGRQRNDEQFAEID